MVEHLCKRRIRRQFGKALLRRRKTACHVESVIAVPSLCVHRREIVFLRHDRSDDRIHCITYVCHCLHHLSLV